MFLILSVLFFVGKGQQRYIKSDTPDNYFKTDIEGKNKKIIVKTALYKFVSNSDNFGVVLLFGQEQKNVLYLHQNQYVRKNFYGLFVFAFNSSMYC